MNPQRIFAITTRIISQFRRDHRSLGLLFVAPIIIMSLFGFVFRSQEESIVKVALVSEDAPDAGQTSLSAPMITALKSDSRMQVTEMSRADAERAVRDGEQRLALIFGPSFTSDMTASRKTGVEVIVEGANPGQASGALATVGQSLQSVAPQLYRSVVPPQFVGMLPQGSPLKVTTTRLYGNESLGTLDFFTPMFIAYIAFFLVFLLTSVSFLRERTQGTMERLAASPVTRLEMVLGYMFGFGFFAALQSAVLLLFTVFALQVQYTGNLLSIFVVTLALVLGAVNLGIFLSAFARNELQAIQFIPIVILPQVILSGLLWPINEMPAWLQAIARTLPLTYAIDALTDIMIRGKSIIATWLPISILFIFAAVAALLAVSSVRREVA